MLKKGFTELLLTPTFVTVLVLGFILITLIGKINALGTQLSFEKEFIATDLGLSMNALQAVRGNAYLTFSGLAKYGLNYSLSPSVIEVFQGKKDSDKSRGIYYFTEDGSGGISISHKELVSKSEPISDLTLVRQGGTIGIESRDVAPFKANLMLLDCPKKVFPLLQSIVIDPGHGWNEQDQKGDKGNVNEANGWVESLKVLEMANMLQMLTKAVKEVRSTRGWTDDYEITMQNRVSNAQGDALISLHLGSSPDLSKNHALAYYNVNSAKKEQSIKLGCLILNALSNLSPAINGIAYVPVNVDNELKINPESPFAVLAQDKIAVLLEIGNMQRPLPNFMIDKPLDLVKGGIYRGVSDYQGIR